MGGSGWWKEGKRRGRQGQSLHAVLYQLGREFLGRLEPIVDVTEGGDVSHEARTEL